MKGLNVPNPQSLVFLPFLEHLGLPLAANPGLGGILPPNAVPSIPQVPQSVSKAEW